MYRFMDKLSGLIKAFFDGFTLYLMWLHCSQMESANNAVLIASDTLEKQRLIITQF